MRSTKTKTVRRFRPDVSHLENRRLLTVPAITYAGMDGSDFVGPTAAVGPDGTPDIHIVVSGVPTTPNGTSYQINQPTSLTINGPTNFSWEYGTNPSVKPNIYYQVEPINTSTSTTETIDIYINRSTLNPGQTQSQSLPSGSTLTLALGYNANGTSTTFNTSFQPALSSTITDTLPTISPVVTNSTTYTVTLGNQDPTNGYSQFTIAGLPVGATFKSINLSDAAGNFWFLGSAGDWVSFLHPGNPVTTSTSTSYTIEFCPLRPEAGSMMTLQYQLNNDSSGTLYTYQFSASSSQTNPNLRDPVASNLLQNQTPIQVHATSTVNQVNYTDSTGTHTTDIQTLLDMAGSATNPQTNFVFNSGTYLFNEMLNVNHSEILNGVGSSSVIFSFNFGATSHNAAISIHASHTTLEGFTVSFTNQTQTHLNRGIIDTDNQDTMQYYFYSIVDINLLNLNLQAVVDSQPSTAPGDPYPNAMTDIYLGIEQSGVIKGNTLYGGGVYSGQDVEGEGPWYISNNTFTGTPAGTTCIGIFSIDHPVDVYIQNNTANILTSGYTGGDVYDFFVSAAGGYNVNLTGNNVAIGINPSKEPGNAVPNHVEEILTENYPFLFEGNITALNHATTSSGGSVYAIPHVQTGAAVLTILDGPNAGAHYNIAQTFPTADSTGTCFVLQGFASLPQGNYDIALSGGYRNYTIQNNTFNLTGTVSTALVLSSEMSDVNVSGNIFIGDGTTSYSTGHVNQAIRVESGYTEGGPFDGWSYLPMSGIEISNNTIVNSIDGISFYMNNFLPVSKTTIGRTYLFADFSNNQFVYSTAYQYPNGSLFPPISVGNGGWYASVTGGVVSLASGATGFSDPRDMSLTMQGNTIQWNGVTPPSYSMNVVSGEINGVLEDNVNSSIPLASSTYSQVNLSGGFSQVGITDPSNPTAGSFDPYGNSYSSQDLGNIVVWNGETFNIGTPGLNNIFQAGGVPITLPQGKYTSIQFLGAAIRGVQPASPLIIHYTDGSTVTYSQAFSDWGGGYTGGGTTAPGETLVKTMAYHDSTTGRVAGNVYLYGYSFPVDPTKTVSYMEIANNNNVKILAVDEISQPSQVNLFNSFSQIGITDPSNPTAGSFDPYGNSYSSQDLGTSVTWNGQTFNIGPAGLNDIFQAGGVPLTLPQGKFTSIQFLGAAIRGVQPATPLILHYTDGSTVTFSQAFSDWGGGYTGGGTTAPGETLVKTMAYHDSTTGRVAGNVYLYGYSFPVDPTKTVSYMEIANNNNVKILAVDEVYQPSQVNLNASVNGSATAFNQTGITTDDNTTVGLGTGFVGLDGTGNSYSANQLGNTITWGAATFNIGDATLKNVVQSQASAVSITLPQGQYTSIEFLGTAVNGSQVGTFTVNYTTGSPTVVTQTLSDWTATTTASGETVVKTMTNRNTRSGSSSTSGPFHLYGYVITIDPTRTVSSLSFSSSGNNSNIIILAVDMIKNPPQVNLSASVNGSATAFNQIGITTDDNTTVGQGTGFVGLDGTGNSYSANQLGNTITWGTSTFNIGDATLKNVVQSQASPVTITLPQGQYTSIQFLGTGVNGSQVGTFTVNYTTGSPTVVTQTLSDWTATTTASGETLVKSMTSRNTRSGSSTQFGPYHLYGYSITVDSTRTVSSLTFSSSGNNSNIIILAVDVLGQHGPSQYSMARTAATPVSTTPSASSSSGAPLALATQGGSTTSVFAQPLGGATATSFGTFVEPQGFDPVAAAIDDIVKQSRRTGSR